MRDAMGKMTTCRMRRCVCRGGVYVCVYVCPCVGASVCVHVGVSV